MTTRDEKPGKKSEQQPARASSTPEEPVTAPVVAADVPLITVEKFIRSVKNKELASAFAHVEGLQRPVRRKSQADWQKDFDAWLVQPRG